MAHPNLCLSRVDNHSSHGWMVRIAREDRKITKFFSDSKLGGRRTAQQAAKDFRDRILDRYTREGVRARANRIVLRQKRNKTGMIGVTRVDKPKPDGSNASYYSVTWHPRPGVARATTVSIAKHGQEKAFRLACAIRNRELMRRFGSGVFRKMTALKKQRG